MGLALKELKSPNIGDLSYRLVCTKVRDAEVEWIECCVEFWAGKNGFQVRFSAHEKKFN